MLLKNKADGNIDCVYKGKFAKIMVPSLWYHTHVQVQDLWGMVEEEQPHVPGFKNGSFFPITPVEAYKLVSKLGSEI